MMRTSPIEPDEKQDKASETRIMSRWEKRKLAVLEEQKIHDLEAQPKPEEEEEVFLTDEDMPPIEELTADSDYSGFMSPRVSDQLRRLALRKLFHGADFNICDGLDDYDGDYTSFAKLGDIITSDMKHQVEMELRKKARLLEEEAEKEALEESNENSDQDEAEQGEIEQDGAEQSESRSAEQNEKKLNEKTNEHDDSDNEKYNEDSDGEVMG